MPQYSPPPGVRRPPPGWFARVRRASEIDAAAVPCVPGLAVAFDLAVVPVPIAENPTGARSRAATDLLVLGPRARRRMGRACGEEHHCRTRDGGRFRNHVVIPFRVRCSA